MRLYHLFVLIIVFMAVWMTAIHLNSRESIKDIEQLEVIIEEQQQRYDSLEQVARVAMDSSRYWQQQLQLTAQQLDSNSRELDHFFNQQSKRNAQLYFITGAAAAELDSFFAARYQRR